MRIMPETLKSAQGEGERGRMRGKQASSMYTKEEEVRKMVVGDH